MYFSTSLKMKVLLEMNCIAVTGFNTYYLLADFIKGKSKLPWKILLKISNYGGSSDLSNNLSELKQ